VGHRKKREWRTEGNPSHHCLEYYPERCCPDRGAGHARWSVSSGYDQGKQEREKLRRMKRGGG